MPRLMTSLRGGLLAVALAVTPALADDEIVRGAIVKVEHQEVYISVGTQQGVTDGTQIRVKRPIKLRHPVTRTVVEDWVPVGAATVTQAGGALSRAVVGGLVGEIRVGDVVEALLDRPERPPPSAPAAAPEPAARPPADPAATEVLGLFASQTGQPLDARIAGWERYLSIRAESPYADAIRRDIETLRGLRDQLQPGGAARGGEAVGTVQHEPRAAAPAGAALPVVFVLDQPERVASAFLHYRRRDARTYRRVLLVREHEIYLRGAIPADAVAAPGVDYFVEVSTPSGSAGLALGAPTEPVQVAVAAPPLIDRFGPRPGVSSVKLAVDYLDFATFDDRAGDRTDRVITGNVDFTYGLDSAVQSIGVGYGVFAGAGGYADRAWTATDPFPESGFHFGYADVELGGEVDHVALAFAGKLIAGVGKEGFGMGVEGRFRLGPRDQTNLVLMARTIDQIGYLTDIRFGARPARDLLVGLSVGATNQPNRGDVGVKLGTELEWIGFRNVSVILRGSWQGRNVDHGGIGGGAGLGVYW